MKKKTVLVSISKTWIYSNTGIDMLAGYLRPKGHSIDINYYHQGEDIDSIIKDIDINHDIYGFSVYSSNYYDFIRLSEYVKSNNHKAIIVWGGSFPTMYYEKLLSKHECIDYIILGDGEYPMEYLLNSIYEGKDIHHDSIAFADDKNAKFPYLNNLIDHLPVWDYYEKILPEMNKYKIHCIQSKNNICTGMCSFCFERKGRITYKGIDTIIKEVDYVTSVLGVKKIYFTDDNLLDPNNQSAKLRIWDLCKAIEQLNKRIIFTCYIKAISFKDTEFDNQLLRLMSYVGFATMFIGIESGNNEDLKLYNKLTNVNDNYMIIDLLERYNIQPLVGFINFNPYSNLEKLKQNFIFLSKIKSVNLFSYACSFLNIYEGTVIYEKAKNDGLLKDSYSLIDDLEYCFQDKDAEKIISFLKENVIQRIDGLRYQTSWIMQKCEDAIRLNSEAIYLKNRLIEWKSRDYVKIQEFFSVIFIENDLDKAYEKIDRFFDYFEKSQVELRSIVKEIGEYFE